MPDLDLSSNAQQCDSPAAASPTTMTLSSYTTSTISTPTPTTIAISDPLHNTIMFTTAACTPADPNPPSYINGTLWADPAPYPSDLSTPPDNRSHTLDSTADTPLLRSPMSPTPSNHYIPPPSPLIPSPLSLSLSPIPLIFNANEPIL